MSPIVPSGSKHSLYKKKPESSLDSFPEFQTEPFPDEALTPTLRAMAWEISKGERVPVSLPAACLLGLTSASIGKGLQVQSGPQRKTMGNIYVVPSADSGSGKSQVFRYAFEPFREHEKYDREQWEKNDQPTLEANKDILEEEIKKLRKKIEKSGSVTEQDRSALQEKRLELKTTEEKLNNPPIYSVEDITTEALAVRLKAGNGTLASLSADAGDFINNILGRYMSNKNRTDESLYVKFFSGDRCEVDRIGRDRVSVDQPCLTGLWLVQPDKIESLLAEPQLIDGGLIPRFLMCHTNAEQEEIIGEMYIMDERKINTYDNVIHTLMDKYLKAEEPYIIKPTSEALERMNEYYNEIVRRLKRDLKDIKPFASRWAEQAWRIAVVLHASALFHTTDLSLDTADRAIRIMKWFANEQLAILSGGRELAWQKMKDKVLAFLNDRETNPNGEIKKGDLSRKRFTRSAQEGEEVLKRMEDEGTLISHEEMPEGGGTISRIYTRTPVQTVQTVQTV